MKQQEEEVRRYYDRNTQKFLRLSRPAGPKAIHQPLYATNGMSLGEALHTQHNQILQLLPKTNTPCILLDVGCGVGESMIYLAQHTPANYLYYGITLSGSQARFARKRIASAGLHDRIHVIEGSYTSLPYEIPKIDLAFAIESFIHSTDPSKFFLQLRSVLKPQSRLVLFDDFLKKDPETQTAQRILSDLKTGWLANTLITLDRVSHLAKHTGLQQESVTDLSGMLRLTRLRDRFIHCIAPIARMFMSHSQYCRFLVGGDARQEAYRNNLLQYAMLVYIKR